MLNSSLRRMARCPTAPALSSRPSTPTPITATLTSGTHQRKHSSSKPPVRSSSRSSAIPASSVKTVGTKAHVEAKGKDATAITSSNDAIQTSPSKETTEKRPGVKLRMSNRRAASLKKDSSNEWLIEIPSVPPTHHLTRSDVHDASLYSMHRPISITSSLPPQTTQEQFEKLFEPKSKSIRQKNSKADVLYTLSSAVETLDEHIAQQQRQGPPRQVQINGAAQQRSDIITALTRHNSHAPNNNTANSNRPAVHLDGQSQLQIKNGANVAVAIQEIARRFRPFNPPAVPIPVSDAEISARDNEAAVQEEEVQAQELEEQVIAQDSESSSPRQFQEILMTVQRNANANPHSQRSLRNFFTPRIQIEISESPQAEGRRVEDFLRPDATGGRRRGPGPAGKKIEHKYYMISVRRQRKLKMKKHKYKKLMRKTRNLRRRQDKL